MDSDSTRQKLIDATLRCIEVHGLQATTSRLIAETAQLNGALINYHFGSKRDLVDEAIGSSLDGYLSDFFGEPDERSGEAGGLEAVLSRFLTEALKDAISSPRITKSYLHDALMHGDYRGAFVKKLNSFLRRLAERAGCEKFTGGQSKLELVQMVSSVLLMGLMPDLFSDFLGLDLRKPVNQKKFVESLMKRWRASRDKPRNELRPGSRQARGLLRGPRPAKRRRSREPRARSAAPRSRWRGAGPGRRVILCSLPVRSSPAGNACVRA